MEVEIRAQIKNRGNVEGKLKKLGAKLIKKTRQIDKYFGEINLYRKIGYSFLMRVRDEGNKKFLAYKGAKLKKDGVWEEYEFEIDDVGKAIKMLKGMGMEEIIVVKKHRKEYALNGFTFCLDNIRGLGSFIEIEYSGDKNFSKKKNKETDLIKRLGIKKNQILDKGYVTMLLSRNKSPYSKYIVN